MKRRQIIMTVLAAAIAGLAGCNSNQGDYKNYEVTVEPLMGMETTATLDENTSLALWAEGTAPEQAYISEIDKEGVYRLVRSDSSELTGTVCVVYPATAVRDPEHITIASRQQQMPLGMGMVLYGETTDAKTNHVALKAASGVIHMHCTTKERLMKASLSTDDSNRYLTGCFTLSNYPFPVLGATEESMHWVETTGIEAMDFAGGGDLYFYVAPGCYSTFTITLTTTEGKVCTKHLKDGKEVVVDRNRVCNINLGSDNEDLVFE